MGTFNYTYTVAYQNNVIQSSPVQGPFALVLDDGDTDSTFELGDVVTSFSSNYGYEGTVNVDGTDFRDMTESW